MRNILIFILKAGLIVALFSFLVVRALKGSVFHELNAQNFNYAFLLLGILFNLLGTTITIVRWRALVEATSIPLPIFEAFKIGFIGFMFNLSPIGIVGGDAVKVVLLTQRRNISAELATASVVIDRVVGLYVMFLLGLTTVFCTGFYQLNAPLAKFATWGVVILAAGTTLLLALFLLPIRSNDWRIQLSERVPFVGKILKKFINAILEYRSRGRILVLAFFETIFVHLSFALSLYYIARGLYAVAPSITSHVVLYSLGNVGSIIPLSAGPLELFLDELYPLFPIVGRAPFELGYGMTIGATYRLATVAVAFIGVLFYLLSYPKGALSQCSDK